MTTSPRRKEQRNAAHQVTTIHGRKSTTPRPADVTALRDFSQQGPLVTRRIKDRIVRDDHFTTHDLLLLVGLDGADQVRQNILPNKGLRFNLNGGAWDPATAGGHAVDSEAKFNAKGEMTELVMRLTIVHPSGYVEVRELFNLQFAPKRDILELKELRFAGHHLALERGELIMQALGAMGKINNAFRSRQPNQPIFETSDFPDLGKILGVDFSLMQEIGWKLDLPGIKAQGGFGFLAEAPSNAEYDEPLRLPRAAFEALVLGGINALDPHRNLQDVAEAINSDPQQGGLFRCRFERQGNSFTLRTMPVQSGMDQAKRTLAHLEWRVEGNDIVITRLDCLDEDCLAKAAPDRQATLGVVQSWLRDLRERRYPKIADGLARYSQIALLNSQKLHQGMLTEFPQMAYVPLAGAQAHEIIPGFGADIGANTHLLAFSRRLKSGKASRRYFMFDAGIGFSKLKDIIDSDLGNPERIMANVLPYFRDMAGFALSHLHEDHVGAAIDFSRMGYLKDKPCYATGLVCRVMCSKLKKAKVPEALWPKFIETNEPTTIPIMDADGLVGTVDFLPRMFRHSTENSALMAAAAPYLLDQNLQPVLREGETVPPLNLHYWACLFTGDLTFGKMLRPDYRGHLPPDTGFKPHYLADWQRRHNLLFPHRARYTRQLQGSIAMITEATSIHRDGHAPDVMQVFENHNLIRRWFKDKGEINVMLSTATSTSEMLVWKATQHGMMLTALGAYLLDRIRDYNMAGLNYDFLQPDGKGDELEKYADKFAELVGLPPALITGFHTKVIREAILDKDFAKILIAVTGSQNSVIEKDAIAIQIAQFRSVLQSDPLWRRNGLGIDISGFVAGFLQAAIPGNDESQLQLVRDLCHEKGLNLTAFVPVHDGTRFFNVKEPALSEMKTDLNHLGYKYAEMAPGELYVYGFATYAPGHMWKEDLRLLLEWAKDNGVSKVGFTHYPNDYNVRVGMELAAAVGLQPLPQLRDHDVITRGDCGKKVFPLGRIQQSYILARELGRPDLYYNKIPQYNILNLLQPDASSTQAGFHLAGNPYYLSTFGVTPRADAQQAAKGSHPRRRRDDLTSFLCREVPMPGDPPIMPHCGLAMPHAQRSPLAGPVTARERQQWLTLRYLAKQQQWAA